MWTSIQLAMCIVEFLHIDNFMVPSSMPFGYIFLLILYIIKKESNRWLDKKWKKRRGEIYLMSWFVVMLAMIIVEFFSTGEYQVPWRLTETIIGIVAAYLAAMISIILHHLINSENVVSLLRLYLRNNKEVGLRSQKGNKDRAWKR